MTSKNGKKTTETFKCSLCHKRYKIEQAFKNHLSDCPVGNRLLYLEDDPRPFQIWRLVNPKVEDFFDERMKFANSKNFMHILNFCLKCDEDNWQFIVDYAAWLINNNITMYDWTNIEYYHKFVKLHLLRENPKDALERSLQYIIDNDLVGNFFATVSVKKFILWMETGDISPWMIFICPESEKLIERMDAYEHEEFLRVVNIDRWEFIMGRYTRTFGRLRETMEGVTI